MWSHYGIKLGAILNLDNMNVANFQPYELDEQVTEVFASLTKTSENWQLVICTLYKATKESWEKKWNNRLPLDVCVSFCLSVR